VDHPESVVIDEQMDGETTVLTIHVHADDMGQVIGKSGRIIRAIRDLMKIVAVKHNSYIDVALFEEIPPVEEVATS
jgi:predicted RNA-binding protein YlqC (UPF0109 family)